MWTEGAKPMSQTVRRVPVSGAWRILLIVLRSSILAILCLSILDLGGDSNDAHPKGLPQGTAGC